MEYQNKSNEKLQTELQTLQNKYDALEILYQQAISSLNLQKKELTETEEQSLKEQTTADTGFEDLILTDETARDNNLRLQMAVDAVDMAWWDMDILTGNIKFHKRKAEMLGYSPDRFHHYKDFTCLLHPEDYERVMQAMRDHFAGLEPMYETEYRILTSSGQYKWFYDMGTVVKKDSQGLPLKVIGFVIDISKRKSVELEIKLKNEQLQKANAEKDILFSIIAHDMRNPLGVLVQITEMILDESLNIDETEKKALLTSLCKSARNSFDLLENLLKWSQMQRGLIYFKPQILEIKEAITKSINICAQSARVKAINLVLEIPSGMKVSADPDMLQCILRNLISNAIKFTPQGGMITISVKSTQNNEPVISVRDTGIGMSNDMRNNLFRIDVNTKRQGTAGEESTGLGLLLCKEFIEKHGGHIWVESEVQKGSEFSFTLPQPTC